MQKKYFEIFSLGEVLSAKAMGKCLVPMFLSTFGNMTHPIQAFSGENENSFVYFYIALISIFKIDFMHFAE